MRTPFPVAIIILFFSLSLTISCEKHPFKKFEPIPSALPRDWYCDRGPELFEFQNLRIVNVDTLDTDHRGRIRMDAAIKDPYSLTISGELVIKNDTLKDLKGMIIVFMVKPDQEGIFVQKPLADTTRLGKGIYQFDGTVTIGKKCPGSSSKIWAMIFCESKLDSIRQIWENSDSSVNCLELPHHITSCEDEMEAIEVVAAPIEKTSQMDIRPEPVSLGEPSSPLATERGSFEDTCNVSTPVFSQGEKRIDLSFTHQLTIKTPKAVQPFPFKGSYLPTDYQFFLLMDYNGKIDRIDFEIKGKNKSNPQDTVVRWRRLDIENFNGANPAEWNKITLDLSHPDFILQENKVSIEEIIFHIEGEKGGAFFMDGILEK